MMQSLSLVMIGRKQENEGGVRGDGHNGEEKEYLMGDAR